MPADTARQAARRSTNPLACLHAPLNVVRMVRVVFFVVCPINVPFTHIQTRTDSLRRALSYITYLCAPPRVYSLGCFLRRKKDRHVCICGPGGPCSPFSTLIRCSIRSSYHRTPSHTYTLPTYASGLYLCPTLARILSSFHVHLIHPPISHSPFSNIVKQGWLNSSDHCQEDQA